MLVANFLIFFVEVAFVLMASVWAKNNLTALSVALISVVAPLIVYMVVPGSFGEWLSTLIPAGGIGLSNALLYKMISFDFLYAGGHAFFQADVLLASAPIKIVLLVGLAAWGYLRKKKKGGGGVGVFFLDGGAREDLEKNTQGAGAGNLNECWTLLFFNW